MPLTHALTLKLSPDMVRQIDDWRRQQSDLPSRAESIRRMIDQVLSEQDCEHHGATKKK